MIEERMAVVLYGIVGGMVWRNGIGGPINIEECAKTLKYNVLDRYDCDVFIHSWSNELRDRLISAFNPVRWQIEEQDLFGYPENLDHNSESVDAYRFRTLSRWTSTEKAMGLKKRHEELGWFKYKWVMLPRIDTVYFNPIDVTTLDTKLFYISLDPVFGKENWCPTRSVPAIDDRFFLASSDKMDEFAEIAKELRNGELSFIEADSHGIALDKIRRICGGDLTKMSYAVTRFKDIEQYRTVVDFSQGRETLFRHVCNSNGIDLNGRLRDLLREIDENTNV